LGFQGKTDVEGKPMTAMSVMTHDHGDLLPLIK
jgi:hypothetical protein